MSVHKFDNSWTRAASPDVYIGGSDDPQVLLKQLKFLMQNVNWAKIAIWRWYLVLNVAGKKLINCPFRNCAANWR